MALAHDQAINLKERIARDHPEFTVDGREYEQVWTVLVTSSRTNEGFGIVSLTDWQARLTMLEGAVPPETGH